MLQLITDLIISTIGPMCKYFELSLYYISSAYIQPGSQNTKISYFSVVMVSREVGSILKLTFSRRYCVFFHKKIYLKYISLVDEKECYKLWKSANRSVILKFSSNTF